MPCRVKPDPVDVHVGMRLQARRRLCGLTQAELAKPLGLTFQQLHKYETGASRISAGRLWELGKILDVPVSYFFDGLLGTADTVADLLDSRAGLELIRDYEGCSRAVRKSAYLLCKAMSDNPSPAVAKETK